MPISSDIPFDVAAVAGCSVITGFGAVFNTAKVKAGSSVAIIGIGGVGVNIVQSSFLANATTIIAIDVLDKKLEIARQFGATHVVNASNEDVLERITEITRGIGVDFAFEALGRPETILSAFNMIRRGGSAVVVGVSHIQQKVEIPVATLPVSEKNLLGCCYGSSVMSRDLETIFDLYRSRRLKIEESITRRYSLDEINDGFAELKAGNNIRAVVTFYSDAP
jgi:S-(hydroxymethyl)glutathione dehydrogenase/alcohol dehydrogenase